MRLFTDSCRFGGITTRSSVTMEYLVTVFYTILYIIQYTTHVHIAILYNKQYSTHVYVAILYYIGWPTGDGTMTINPVR